MRYLIMYILLLLVYLLYLDVIIRVVGKRPQYNNKAVSVSYEIVINTEETK